MQIITSLASARFRPASARAVVTHLSIGDVIELEPDPFNEYDPQAVRCVFDAEHIGFIAKKDNPEIFAQLMLGDYLSAEIISFENALTPILEINL